MYALDAATGRLRWSYTTGWGVIRSSPAVAGRTVYVGSIDSKVHAPARGSNSCGPPARASRNGQASGR